jgi:phenylacetate-CoA ligase
VASLMTSFISRVLFPLQERLKHHSTVSAWHGLEATQWLAASELRELQRKRYRSLLEHAAQHVPYYRNMFARMGLSVEAAGDLENIARLPLLDKAAIRTHSDALRSDRAGTLAKGNTGGSSGEPLIFYLGMERVSHDVAAKWRATRWWDVDIGDREIVVWGSPIELGAQDRIKAIRDAVFRTELLPAFEMSEAKLDAFVARIRERRPKMLFGYPSSISLIAQHARKRGVRMDDLGIRVAFVTSERLYDHQRETIQAVFGCPVANGYGGRDAGFLAHECPKGGMHITAEDVVLETVDSAGNAVPPGEPGEIVVTHLASRDYPFIRYRTGDVAVLDDRMCPCGRGLPMIRELQGRSTDFVVARDGTVMHGLALIYVLRELPGVAGFKIVQESLSLTRILVVPGDGYTDETTARIRAGIAKRLGPDVEVQVELVSEIAPERSGKYRYVMSRVAA